MDVLVQPYQIGIEVAGIDGSFDGNTGVCEKGNQNTSASQERLIVVLDGARERGQNFVNDLRFPPDPL